MTQRNLSVVYLKQALLLVESTSLDLLEQAKDACYMALQVYTPEDAPFHWTEVQNNLGNILENQAKIGNGPSRISVLKQAEQAYQPVLLLCTRSHAPTHWAF